MSSFEDLKKKAETQVTQDKAVTESWITSNRGWLIAIGITLVVGLILGHAF